MSPGEHMLKFAGYPALTYFRKGAPDKPLLVFIPGGGHLARIAYGHPDLRADDFLDAWLGREGYSLLAISYPSDHAVFAGTYPQMTLQDWGNVAASAAAHVIRENSLSKSIVLLGWSMAGHVVRPFCAAARSLGLQLEAFLSLAATPSLFLTPEVENDVLLTNTGLRETRYTMPGIPTSSHRWWDTAIKEQTHLNGRAAFSEEQYFDIFRANHPLNLNGLQKRFRNGEVVDDLAEAIADSAAFDYGGLPITACLVPTSTNDLRHAATDIATWGFLNSQALFRNWLQQAQRVDPLKFHRKWETHSAAIVAELGALSTYVPGGHLFFTGAFGARSSALAITALLSRVRQLRGRLEAVLN